MEHRKGRKTKRIRNVEEYIRSFESRGVSFPLRRLDRTAQDHDSPRAPRYTEPGGRNDPAALDLHVSFVHKDIRDDHLLNVRDAVSRQTRKEETFRSSTSRKISPHQYISRHIREDRSERSDQKKHGTKSPTTRERRQNIASSSQQDRAAHSSLSIDHSSSQPRFSLSSPVVFTSETFHSCTKRSIETDYSGDRRSNKRQRVFPISHTDTRKRRLSIDEDRTGHNDGIKRQRIDSFDSKPIGFKRLEEICCESDPDKVVIQLTAESGRFKSLLESNDIRVDLVKLVIQTLSKVSQASSMCITNANSFLSFACQKNGGFLICHLSPFISAIPENLLRFDNVSKLLQQICDVLGAMLNRFEKRIVHHISPVILQLKETIDKLYQDGCCIQGKEVSERIEKLLLLRDAILKEAAKVDGGMDTEIPPDDFRALDVVPQMSDFHLCKKPFLRANIVDGTYDNLDHYLDVQFRLLREDFIIPLRESIKEIINSAIHPNEFETMNVECSEPHRIKARNGKNLQMYHNVMVLNPVCSKKKMVYRIGFDTQHRSIRNFKWNRSSKRLKFGSLVCLSSDNFETLHIATVENRDIDGLQVGELEVRFEDSTVRDVNHFINHKVKFDMVESPTFFEAYRHVLKALQNLNEDSLPFQEYIVHCKRDVAPPAYLSQCIEKGKDPIYNLKQVSNYNFVEAELEPGQLPTKDVTEVPVLSRSEWPCAEALGLNESQLRAFQLALTKEFAVIQGPPGTGKTYVGHKIARALLDNKEVWQRDRRSPILMISYTNHALDQFVEGLLDVHGVVRVGGRCKSSRVQEFSLKSVRMERRQQRDPSREMKSISRAHRKTMAQLRDLKQSKSLEEAADMLRTSRRCIISLRLMKEFIRPYHFSYFNRHQKPNGDEKLLQWLKIEKVQNKDDRQNSSQNFYESEDFHRQFSARFFADDEDEMDEENSRVTSACTLKEAKNTSHLKSLLGNPETADAALERRIIIERCSFRQRWMLYRLWRQRLENHYRKRLQENQERYEEILAKKQEIELKEDEYILSHSKVIAMTTTCAARYSSILQRISPKIIIAEEAAEVLEAHVITALNPGCQHLILIGDHQQLRPNPNVYDLAKRFKLDVSLFERMVHVGLDCVQLSVQHRMRPEISALLRPIYKDLQDCEEVSEYENVIGMKKNLFFLNHQEPEHENEDSHSYCNQHEAQFLVALCRYLLQQGYKPSEVTMLTTYTGQMFAILEYVRSLQDDKVNSVRVTTVDNFQGEENKIILLSLVRSNAQDKPGFIKVTNRACVALSRAKIGFYCIGNFTLLSKHSEIWCKIVGDLRRNELVGDRLSLVCPQHNDRVSEVKCCEDFEREVKFGGCQEPCMVRLRCGHTCPKTCHSDDRDHKKFRCNKECIKRIRYCNYGHPCPKLCFEKCPEKCVEEVQKTLPCHHTQDVICWVDETLVKCKSRCERVLACGHQCQDYCGDPCTTDCKELVKRRDWSCGHEVTIACSATQEDCTVPCGALLKCGHVCSGKCGECRQGRVHMPCKYKCGRILVCSHPCKERCTGPCPPCSHDCENSCFHSNCDKKCGDQCVPCMEKCRWECKHFSCDKLCSQMCERKRCNRPCNDVLPCGHRCRGLCNEDCVCVKCHTNGGEPITNIFLGGEDEEDARFIKLKDCKHIFAVSDMDRYMEVPSSEIQLKGCPRCTTPIRRSYRYGNIIKHTLMEIAKVKEKLQGDKEECKERQKTLLQKITELKEKFPDSKSKFGVQPNWRTLKSRAKSASDDSSLATTENQLILTQTCCELTAKVKEEVLATEKSDPERKVRVDCLFILKELQYMVKRINANRTSQREMDDINIEISRLSLFVELCRLQADVKCYKVQLQDCHQEIVVKIRDVMESRKLVDTDALGKYRDDLAAVRREYASLSPISPEEKRQIVEAMNLQKGHWFQCPEGHVYAIGECGGAMERGRCPECNAVIGGERHRLVEGNTLASEMDGAQYSAWSEQANLENYVLD